MSAFPGCRSPTGPGSAAGLRLVVISTMRNASSLPDSPRTLEHEPILLRLPERIGPFLFKSGFCVASTKNGSGKRMARTPDGDLALLALPPSKRPAVFGGSTVDFVGQDYIREQRAVEKFEIRWPVALSSCRTSVPVMSDGMRSGVNWMRLS